MPKNHVLKHIKILTERGFGPTPFGVTGEDDKHYEIIDSDDNRHKIFKVHCYRDADCLKADRALKIQRAEKIGQKA